MGSEGESDTVVENVGVRTEKNLCLEDELYQGTEMKTGLGHLAQLLLVSCN